MDGAYERLSLTGRVIAITGGTGGLGSETARLCAARGASVVIADLSDAAGEALVASIRSRGGKAAYIRTNVSCEIEVKAMVDFAVSTFGGLHGGFNNAGIATGYNGVADLPLERWQRSMDVNLTGVFLCMKHEIAHMLTHGGGAIVNTSSTAGAVGIATSADYVASKHGVVGVTRAAAVDYSSKGVRVNAILPGSVWTPMVESALKEHPTLREIIERGHAIGRMGQPFEIAETVAWLLSDAASFITGASISADGGYTTW
jgi:2,5-dichloro-2,5-cyclohexadiene-1,4-diol dehydrogenase 1